MSEDLIERILATYEPVEGRPGYVWMNKANNTIVKIDVLRAVYKDEFQKEAHEIDDKKG